MDDKTTDVDGAYLPLLRKKCTAGVGECLYCVGLFPQEGGYLLPVDVRSVVSYKSRVYTARPDSQMTAGTCCIIVMG